MSRKHLPQAEVRITDDRTEAAVTMQRIARERPARAEQKEGEMSAAPAVTLAPSPVMPAASPAPVEVLPAAFTTHHSRLQGPDVSRSV